MAFRNWKQKAYTLVVTLLGASIAVFYQNCGLSKGTFAAYSSDFKIQEPLFVFKDVRAASQELTSNSVVNSGPLTAIAPEASDVYIYWAFAEASVSKQDAKIDLYSTSDEATYRPIAIGLGLHERSTCPNFSETNGFDGCFRWVNGAPTSGYFRVRVGISTTEGATLFSSSNPMNIGTALEIVAGNIDTGLNGDARRAIFFSNDESEVNGDPDNGSLVVSKNGTIFFRDARRGILKISMSDGKQTLFLKTSGSSTGDNGPVESASARAPYRIGIDDNDQLYVWDFDRIRKIDALSPNPKIETIIGGGVQSTDAISDAKLLRIDAPEPATNWPNSDRSWKHVPFVVLPNGDIIFQSDTYVRVDRPGARFRHYHAATKMVTSTFLTGHVTLPVPGSPEGGLDRDLTSCSFGYLTATFSLADSSISNLYAKAVTCDRKGDWIYSAPVRFDNNGAANSNLPPSIDLWGAGFFHTGRDGELYHFGRINAYVGKFDPLTNQWTKVLGYSGEMSEEAGTCPDGTLATQCRIDIDDMFVGKDGTITFVERGLIRRILPKSAPGAGTVITVAGEPRSSGDGKHRLQARFSKIDNFDMKTDGTILVGDSREIKIREFLGENPVVTVAGNGNLDWPSVGARATAHGLRNRFWGAEYYNRFSVNPSSGDLYLHRNHAYISKIDRKSGEWSDLVGGGTIAYYDSSANDQLGNRILLNKEREGGCDYVGFPPNVFGFGGGNILVLSHSWNCVTSNHQSAILYEVNTADGKFRRLAGVTGPVNYSDRGDGFCVEGSSLDQCEVPNADWPDITQAEFDSYSNRWLIMRQNKNVIRAIARGQPMSLLTRLEQGASSFVYRRNADLSLNEVFYCGTSKKRLRKRDIAKGTDFELPWPTPLIECTGKKIVYDARRNRILFPFNLNGMSGIAAYVNPP